MIQTKETLTWVTLKRVESQTALPLHASDSFQAGRCHHVVIRHNNTASNNN
jgi:hypothetical protein